MIAYDFETHLISNETPWPKPVCLSFYDGKKEGLIVGHEEMSQKLKEMFRSGELLIAHNHSFEANVIDTWFPEHKDDLKRAISGNKLACTKVYEQLLDNTRKKQLQRFGLDSLVKSYFKEDISAEKKDPDAWRLRYSELEGIPLEEWPKEAVSYAINDSIWTYKAYMKQKATSIDCSLSVAADIYLNKMGSYGLLVDKERVLTLEKELLDIIVPRYKELEKLELVSYVKSTGKYKKNMTNFRTYMEENIPAVEKTVKGNTSTSKESMGRYLATLEPDTEAHKVVLNFLEIMKYEKMLTAYVARLKTADPIIRTSYRAAVSSGRTSSSSSKAYPSVNIQQMPRTVEGVTWDVRNCFVPREGYKICSIDYAGLELASTSNQLFTLTGKRDMLDVVNSGDKPRDMHSMLAYRIMNMKEKTNETYESFVKNKKKEPYAGYRQLAKPINLGFPGGIGFDTMRSLLIKDGINPKLVVLESSVYESNLAWKRRATRKEGYPTRVRRTGFKEFQLVYDELVALKQELYGLYPDLEYFLTEGHNEYLTGEKKMVKNEYNEWEPEPMYAFNVGDFQRDWCMYTQVCNGLLMQSPAAIGAKKAMVKLIETYGDSKVVRPLAFIHDEIVFEVVEDEDLMKSLIKDVSETLIDEMQSTLKHVRIAVEAEVFDYWKKAGGDYCVTYFKDPEGKGGLACP